MQLIKGDTIEEMKKLPDNSIDMILCDLPYQVTQAKWDILIPFEDLWCEYNRLIKDGLQKEIGFCIEAMKSNEKQWFSN